MADRADFNSNRRFYRWTNDVAEYLEDMAGRERQAEVGTVAELLEEIESENLYQVLVTVDGRTLKIVLLKMQGKIQSQKAVFHPHHPREYFFSAFRSDGARS